MTAAGVDRPRAKRPKLLFVGAFPPPGSPIIGGNVSDCQALLDSSLPKRLQLLLVDSTEDVGRQTLWKRLVRASGRALRFTRLIHTERPAAAFLLASHGLSFIEKSLLVVYARAFGVPSLLSVRSGHFIDQSRRSAPFRWVAWALLRAPARLVCQGRRWQVLFAESFGIPEARCPIVDSWVAAEPLLDVGRNRRARPGAPTTLLFLGALERAKGLYELLEAFDRIQADPAMPETVLVVGGGGSLRDELEDWVRRKRLGKKVRVAGILSGEAKLGRLRDADIFVLPSHTEGLPNAMVEAMASGLPVVVTPVGSIPDIVTDGVNGSLVPARDSGALERALRRLLQSPELRERLGQAAHRMAEARFRPEVAAACLERLVLEVMKTQVPP